MHLRHTTTQHMLACWFGVVSSTITRALGGAALARCARSAVTPGGRPKASTASAPTGRSGPSTTPRFGSAGRPPGTSCRSAATGPSR
ncbi:helix-turn-helix domain-containing protein [Streptomyces lancefieldiae]|uniref:hypothetical protein n=1 Tax=Streptomyces lancefieldiae TaxID=3075520 RepID=UPI00374E0441